MLISRLNPTAVIAIVLVLCLGRSDSFAAQQPARDKPKVKPADNTPRPYRVIGDRRVDFPLASLVFSCDRKMLATVGGVYAVGALPMYKVVLVDVATGQTLHELQTFTVLVNQIAFAPDGKTLYTGS